MLQDGDDDDDCWLAWTFVLDFDLQFLKHLTVTVCTECGVTQFEVQKWGPMT
jgi:hypothetical protein